MSIDIPRLQNGNNFHDELFKLDFDRRDNEILFR